ncbi:M56 family peptidase [Rheinheimera riviphila]|uniref:Protein TonB n=2 Tax=Rheinheimera riviphila TaxID=1834037 RepID=A0A437QMQ7_9GAMM|nr:M56 family metallopeptidase [Rheinheimera riviphila]RVU35689.1 M56 family peptidase [Rheinheimera riviphila]
MLIVKVTAQQLQQLQQQLQQHDWLVWVWAVGVMAVVTMIGVMHWSLQRMLQQAQPIPVSDSGLPTGLCYQSDQLTGPHISGFLQPKVLLPRDFSQRFSPQQQQLILRHELAHWQRGDLHCNYLALALLAVSWFNPLIWLAYRRYRQDQELACDALVLKNASQQDRIAYGYALVSNLQQAANGWQPLTYHYGDKQMMKQRLMQLQQSKGFSKTAVLGGLALVVASALWLQQPAYAGAEQPQPQMRVEPKYPVQAAQQRITGYVQAEFNIQPDGSVTDVKVIKAEPAEIFNKEAIRALEKWRYQPSAEGVKGATVQLDFMMDPPESGMEQIKVKSK